MLVESRTKLLSAITHLFSALLFATTPFALAAEEVNVYSYRKPELIQPMFDEFTTDTGIAVNVVFAKKGML